MALILILDTSTEKGVVALAKGKELLFSKYLPLGMQSSQFLPSLVAEAFSEVGLSLSELDALAVGIGPGSFTGIRVGVAFAKGLKVALNLPLIGFCSLVGFVPEEEGPFFSVLDARMERAYYMRQERKKGGIYSVSPLTLVSTQLLKEEIKGELAVGPTLHRLTLPNSQEVWPSATCLAAHVEEKFLKKEFNSLQIHYPSQYAG